MSAERMTDWYHPNQKPKRKGAYEIETQFGSRFSRWNGSMWSYFTPTLARLEMFADEGTHEHGRFPWRGLAYDPAKATPP